MLKEKDPAKKFAALRASEHPQAQFLWAMLPRHCSTTAPTTSNRIADTARDVDLAIRWGYGWSLGPFETWQAAGWKQVAEWIAEDIVAGKAMSNAPLPDWVFDGRDGVHGADGSYSPARNAMVPRSANPVYARQRFPDPLLGEKFSPGRTVFENDGVRMWADEGDGIAVVSFKTKLHTVNDQVLNGLQEAIAIAERDFRGLVIWQPKEPFSAGADLAGALGLLQAGDVDGLRGDGRQLPGDQPAHQVCAGAGGRRGARPGAGRRLRIPDACARAPCSRSRATSAWSKPASACCRPAAA